MQLEFRIFHYLNGYTFALMGLFLILTTCQDIIDVETSA